MYLFHFIVILNPDFNCSNNLLSFSADKVTMGTYNLQSVISNLVLVRELIRFATAAGGPLKALPTSTPSLYQDKINVISQLINGTSKLLQKLPKYFNGIAIVTSPISSSPGSKLPVISVLQSKDFKFLIEIFIALLPAPIVISLDYLCNN